MAVKVGGTYVSALGTRAANEACRELRAVNGTVDFADYVVDLCFMTYEQGGLGAEYAEGVGIGPGMVGRKQRRFIVNVEVPPTLTDRTACQAWITDALAQAAAIVRDYLPLKGKDYPADRLAAEVVELRDRWVGHIKSTAQPSSLVAHPLTSPPTALRRRNLAEIRLLSVDPGQAGAIVRIITQFFCPFDRW